MPLFLMLAIVINIKLNDLSVGKNRIPPSGVQIDLGVGGGVALRRWHARDMFTVLEMRQQ